MAKRKHWVRKCKKCTKSFRPFISWNNVGYSHICMRCEKKMLKARSQRGDKNAK